MFKNNIAESGIRFVLRDEHVKRLLRQTYEFGFNDSKFGEVVYYRTYSRLKEDGSQENWYDTVLRVTNGIFTIRKWYFLTHRLPWDEDRMQARANRLALSMIHAKWLPPGRGLWIMGTKYVYERSSMALYNCMFVEVKDIAKDVAWLMDCLMCGGGVGFGIGEEPQYQYFVSPTSETTTYIIPDTREGWVESVRLLLRSYYPDKYKENWNPTVQFDYSQVRPEGLPIKGFGGMSSGPAPLQQLHERIRGYTGNYINKNCNWTHYVADVCNAVGAAVVVGNVRRSAQIALGSPDDESFLDLKNYDKYPKRLEIGWMSNNTARFNTRKDFEKIPEIAERIRNNGEPGIANMINIQKFGRFGHEGESREDLATGLNPCSEIPLESYEVCNLSEVFPSRCEDYYDFTSALRDATFYSSTVSLYPTHSPETNAIIARNHRIGVSLSGIAEWMPELSTAEAIRWLRDGYKVVRTTNEKLNKEAGVPAAIRTTTIKPSGTISQLAGTASGMHYPIYRHAIRRMVVNKNAKIARVLEDANYSMEPGVEFLSTDVAEGRTRYSKYDSFAHNNDVLPYESETSVVIEFPIYQGKARPIGTVSPWEQFGLLQMLQREYCDNSVSATIYFDPEKDGDQVQHMLSMFLPTIKSVSMLPHAPEGKYPQMPYQEITKDEYNQRIKMLKDIDWSGLSGSDGVNSMYCENDKCELVFSS